MAFQCSPLPTLKLPDWVSNAAKALHKTADESLATVQASRAAVHAACEHAAGADLCDFKPVQIDRLPLLQEELRMRTAADAYLTRLDDEVTAVNDALYKAVDDKRAQVAERLRSIGFEDSTPFKAVIETHPEVVRAVQATRTDCVILGGDDKRENRAAIADLQSKLGRIRQEALAAI